MFKVTHPCCGGSHPTQVVLLPSLPPSKIVWDASTALTSLEKARSLKCFTSMAYSLSWKARSVLHFQIDHKEMVNFSFQSPSSPRREGFLKFQLIHSMNCMSRLLLVTPSPLRCLQIRRAFLQDLKMWLRSSSSPGQHLQYGSMVIPLRVCSMFVKIFPCKHAKPLRNLQFPDPTPSVVLRHPWLLFQQGVR